DGATELVCGMKVWEGKGLEAGGVRPRRSILKRPTRRKRPASMNCGRQNAHPGPVVHGNRKQCAIPDAVRLQSYEHAVFGSRESDEITFKSVHRATQYRPLPSEPPP